MALPVTVLESLLSESSDPKEIVLQLEQSLQLDQAFLEDPGPDTKKLLRCLAMKAKRANRLDVVKHLREITPAGTTGKLGINNISVSLSVTLVSLVRLYDKRLFPDLYLNTEFCQLLSFDCLFMLYM